LLVLVRRLARAAIRVGRLACARERLEEAPPVAAPGGRRDSGRFVRALFAIEPLPADPPFPPARGRHSWFRWLFAPETLPYDDPVPPARRRRSRLATLFSPERLDDSP
jgi:hypothetical protein